MNKINHTFVILAYKDSQYLEECILSLKKQSILSDIIITTSTPSSYFDELAEKYAVPLLINKEKNGISSDWTFAYNSCNTEFVTLTHQDDIYLPYYTEKCCSAFAKQKNDALIVFTNYNELIYGKVVDMNLNMIIKKIILLPFFIKPEINSFFAKKLILSFGNPVCCPSVMYNKKVICSLEFSAEYSYNMDWEMWLKLSKIKGPFIYLREKLITHRLHKGSETFRNIKNKKRLYEEHVIFERIWPAPIAAFLSFIYSLGIKSNEINEKDN